MHFDDPCVIGSVLLVVVQWKTFIDSHLLTSRRSWLLGCSPSKVSVLHFWIRLWTSLTGKWREWPKWPCYSAKEWRFRNFIDQTSHIYSLLFAQLPKSANPRSQLIAQTNMPRDVKVLWSQPELVRKKKSFLPDSAMDYQPLFFRNFNPDCSLGWTPIQSACMTEAKVQERYLLQVGSGARKQSL